MLQRRLLERLAALAASVLGGHVPVAVVALDAVGRLLEVLGEVPAEVRASGPFACAKLIVPIVTQACSQERHKLLPFVWGCVGIAKVPASCTCLSMDWCHIS